MDNITKANNEAVDKRLVEIESEREALDREVQTLDRAALGRADAAMVMRETAAFIDGLPGVLTDSAHEDAQAALRRCVEGIAVQRGSTDPKRGAVTGLMLRLRTIPTTVGGPEASATTAVQVGLPIAGRGRSA